MNKTIKTKYIFFPENVTEIPDGVLITKLMSRKKILKLYPNKKKQKKYL